MPGNPDAARATSSESESLELDRIRIERAQLELDRREKLQSQGYLEKHPGVLVTGLISLAAVGVSLLQLLLGWVDQERQWRLQFSEYVSENSTTIFSADAVERTRIRSAMEFAFPRELTDSLLTSVDDVVLLSGVLAPMVSQLNRSKAAFERYGGANRYLEVEVMRDANITVRDLLVQNAAVIPPEYQPDAQALIYHYDVWLDEFERVRGDSIPNERQPFVFAGPRGAPFPTSAERRFRALYAQLQVEVLGVSDSVARAAAGVQ